MAPPMVQLYHNRNVNKNSLLFKVDYTSICEQTTFNWNIYDPMYTDMDLRVSQCTLCIQMQEAISCRRNVDHGNVNRREA